MLRPLEGGLGGRGDGSDKLSGSSAGDARWSPGTTNQTDRGNEENNGQRHGGVEFPGTSRRPGPLRRGPMSMIDLTPIGDAPASTPSDPTDPHPDAGVDMIAALGPATHTRP